MTNREQQLKIIRKNDTDRFEANHIRHLLTETTHTFCAHDVGLNEVFANATQELNRRNYKRIEKSENCIYKQNPKSREYYLEIKHT